MDKAKLKAALLTQLAAQQAQVEADYTAKVAQTKPAINDVIDMDDHAQNVAAAEIADALDSDVHGVEARVAHVKQLDFGLKSVVEEGALVEIGDTFYIVAVSAPRFLFMGKHVVGLTAASPMFVAMEGLAAGDSFDLNQRKLKITAVS